MTSLDYVNYPERKIISSILRLIMFDKNTKESDDFHSPVTQNHLCKSRPTLLEIPCTLEIPRLHRPEHHHQPQTRRQAILSSISRISHPTRAKASNPWLFSLAPATAHHSRSRSIFGFALSSLAKNITASSSFIGVLIGFVVGC